MGATTRTAPARFWRATDWAAGVLEEFAGWFCGKQSPVHMFWHSFDLALARFSGPRAPAAGRRARSGHPGGVLARGDRLRVLVRRRGRPPGGVLLLHRARAAGLHRPAAGARRSGLAGDGRRAPRAPPLRRRAHGRRIRGRRCWASCESAYEAGATAAGWDARRAGVGLLPGARALESLVAPRRLRCRPRAGAFPLGARVTVEALERDPHPILARLRAEEPVVWLPALEGWIVTRRDLAMQVMRDTAAFTVDDPRFSTARVVGPSMLSLDGEAHKRHRDPFARPFRLREVRDRFTGLVAGETDRLIDAIAPAGEAELRRSLAGPLAAAVATFAIGAEDAGVGEVLRWYDAIVASVTEITAGGPPTEDGRRGYASLRAAIDTALERDPDASLVAAAAAGAAGLDRDEVASNAAVLLFGGIETTEGMIANAVLHLLSDPVALAAVRASRSLLASCRRGVAAARAGRRGGGPLHDARRRSRRRPDRRARARRRLDRGGEPRSRGVRRPRPLRPAARRTRSSTWPSRTARTCASGCTSRGWRRTPRSRRVLERLPGLRLDPAFAEPAPRGLVFRKPPELRVRWDAAG